MSVNAVMYIMKWHVSLLGSPEVFGKWGT